jgi:Tfp pilus assembly protein PilF
MPEALTARGLVALSQEKEDQAAPLFEKALKADPTMVFALNPLAALHLSQNRPAQAIPLLERAAAEGFANADTYLLLMRVHLVQAKRDAAEMDFREAMALSTDPPATLKSAADIFIIREMVSQGVALYEEGIRRYPTYVPNYLTLGTYFLQVDQPDRALELYRKALSLDLSPADRQNVTELVAELEGGMGAE